MPFIIPKENLEVWKTLREPQDAQDLVDLTGASLSKVYSILRDGKCSGAKEATQFIHYYAKRLKERNRIQQQLDQE